MNDQETTNRITERRIEVVLVCNEKKRFLLWAGILLSAGANKVLVKCDGDIGYSLDATNLDRSGDLILWDSLPRSATTVLVHSGDAELWKKDIATESVFWFDTPGSPSVSGDDIAILIPTGTSNFQATEYDAKEIIDFSLGIRRDLPSCCVLKPNSRTQSLLAVYLLLRAIQASRENEAAIRQAWDEMEVTWKQRLWANALSDYEKRGFVLEKWSAAGLPDAQSSSISLPKSAKLDDAVELIKFSLADGS